MPKQPANLGRLESVHGIAPAYLQRAVVVAVLSFAFFLAMLIAFYLRQKLGYFLLSSGFLVIYILTMFGWLMLRRSALKIYEHGFSYRKFAARWTAIEAVETTRKGAKLSCEIRGKDGQKTILTDAIADAERVAEKIRARVAAAKTR